MKSKRSPRFTIRSSSTPRAGNIKGANLLTAGAQLVSVFRAPFAEGARRFLLVPDNEMLQGGSRHSVSTAKIQRQMIPWQPVRLKLSTTPTNSKGNLEGNW